MYGNWQASTLKQRAAFQLVKLRSKDIEGLTSVLYGSFAGLLLVNGFNNQTVRNNRATAQSSKISDSAVLVKQEATNQ